MAVLDLGCCAWAFSGCSERRLLLTAAHSLLTDGLSRRRARARGPEASAAAACGLSSGGAQAELLCGA